MEEEMEKMLRGVKPRGMSPELRAQVLAAVGSELKKEVSSVWLRRCGWAVAASLLVGIGLNVWVGKVAERRMAQIFGPVPVSKQAMELARDGERGTDAKTGPWIALRFATVQSAGDQAAYAAYNDLLRQLIDGSFIHSQEPRDEAPKKDSQMERDHSGRVDRHRSGGQCDFRMDYRCTA